jgi:acetyltransferase-like isoleucine patch superfamily enzyme
MDVGPGFSPNNFVSLEGGPQDMPKIKLLRQGAAGAEISGCRLHFGTGSRGNFTIHVGPDPIQLAVGAGTRCVVDIRMWRKPVVEIGAGTTINGCRMVVDDSEVVLGPDCMLSDDILLQGGDQHGLIDLHTLEMTNTARNRIEIGEHVWLGRKSMILPDVTIGPGCVVGAGAIVTASAGPCRYLVGVPARVVREGASWTRNPKGPSEAEQQFFARMRQDPTGGV